MLLVGSLLLVPLLALVATAFVTFDAAALAHLARTVLAETMAVSGLLAAGTLVGTLLIGISCAWCIERYHFPGRQALSWMLVLPLAMPSYVIAYAYTDLLQYSGPIQLWLRTAFGWRGRLPDVRSLTGAIVLFSFVFYPYVYLMTRTALAEMSSSAVESARLLGQSRWGVFWRVVRPLIMPSIVAGAMLVLMETLADVGATYYFGLTTFSAGIYKTWFAMGSRSAALLLAVVLLAAVAAIYLVERRARGRAKQVTTPPHRPWGPGPRGPRGRRGGSGAGAAFPANATPPPRPPLGGHPPPRRGEGSGRGISPAPATPRRRAVPCPPAIRGTRRRRSRRRRSPRRRPHGSGPPRCRRRRRR